MMNIRKYKINEFVDINNFRLGLYHSDVKFGTVNITNN